MNSLADKQNLGLGFPRGSSKTRSVPKGGPTLKLSEDQPIGLKMWLKCRAGDLEGVTHIFVQRPDGGSSHPLIESLHQNHPNTLLPEDT